MLIKCVSCERNPNDPFVNALPMHTLNKVQTDFMKAVAKRFNVKQKWQPPYKKFVYFVYKNYNNLIIIFRP